MRAKDTGSRARKQGISKAPAFAALLLAACGGGAPAVSVSQIHDAGPVDAGIVDAGSIDAGVVCVPGPTDAGNTWSERCPVTVPIARYAPVMTYDSNRKVTVLFGGGDGAITPRSDTLEWDGTNWNLLTPMPYPPGRVYGAMAFDSARGVSVVFGGLEYDGTCSTTHGFGTARTGCSPIL